MNDTEKMLKLFQSPLVVVNVGSRLFGEALEKQNIETLQVDWKPAAGGDKEMQNILKALGM